MDDPEYKIYNDEVVNLYGKELPELLQIVDALRRKHTLYDTDTVVLIYSITDYMLRIHGVETFKTMKYRDPISNIGLDRELLEDPHARP